MQVPSSANSMLAPCSARRLCSARASQTLAKILLAQQVRQARACSSQTTPLLLLLHWRQTLERQTLERQHQKRCGLACGSETAE